MKTKNNVQKTFLRAAAVIISFVLISFTVSAQEFWKRLLTNSSFNEIALAMTESGKEQAKLNVNTEAAFFYIEEVNDPELTIEDWMTNEAGFNVPSFTFENISDNSLMLEGWMLNSENFSGNTEKEEPLQLENWMINEKNWGL